MKAKKMPKEVFVCWREDVNSDEGFWLNVAADVQDLAEIGETISAGQYVLKNKIKIKSKVVTEISKGK